MTHALFLDTEQSAIIRTALNAAEAFLSARADRVDPDDVIKNSLVIVRLKTQHLLDQLDQPPITSWSALPPLVKRQLYDLLAEMLKPLPPAKIDALWETVVGLALTRGAIIEPKKKPAGV